MDEIDTVKSGEILSQCMIDHGKEYLEEIGEDEYAPIPMNELEGYFRNKNQLQKAINEGYSYEGQPGEFDDMAPYFAFDFEGNLMSITNIEDYLETTPIGEDYGDFMEWCSENGYCD